PLRDHRVADPRRAAVLALDPGDVRRLTGARVVDHTLAARDLSAVHVADRAFAARRGDAGVGAVDHAAAALRVAARVDARSRPSPAHREVPGARVVRRSAAAAPRVAGPGVEAARVTRHARGVAPALVNRARRVAPAARAPRRPAAARPPRVAAPAPSPAHRPPP